MAVWLSKRMHFNNLRKGATNATEEDALSLNIEKGPAIHFPARGLRLKSRSIRRLLVIELELSQEPIYSMRSKSTRESGQPGGLPNRWGRRSRTSLGSCPLARGIYMARWIFIFICFVRYQIYMDILDIYVYGNNIYYVNMFL